MYRPVSIKGQTHQLLMMLKEAGEIPSVSAFVQGAVNKALTELQKKNNVTQKLQERGNKSQIVINIDFAKGVIYE